MAELGQMCTKQCKRCLQTKALEDYYLNKETKDGRHTHCKECAKKISADRRANHPEKSKQSQRRAHLKYTFGITEADYEDMLYKQGGKCGICGSVSNGKRLAIDHDHETGRVRGLLCQQCNTALGLFKDQVELLKKAIDYLT